MAKRDDARRNTRMRFEQWAMNPTCQANTFSAVHNVRMADVAKAAGIRSSFGQSPFAITRGRDFEAALLRDEAKSLREALIRAQIVGKSSTGFSDLRLKMNGGPRVVS